MINASAEQVAAKIKAISLKSLLNIASRVRPDSLDFIAAKIANSSEWVPPTASDEMILIRLKKLSIALPDCFFPEFSDD